jgi:pyruvate dehydrogenase E1 component alpha subunit
MQTALSRATALDLLERMLLIRRFEEAVIDLAMSRSDIGKNHFAIGNEGVDAPAMVILEAGDLVHTTHRNHGQVIARGVDPGKALAEILGRTGGMSKGRAGTIHLSDRAAGFQPTSAMVGGSLGLALGGGLAVKQAGAGRISVAIFGDGALDEGISYESLNMAALLVLPILFLCENNGMRGAASAGLNAKQIIDIPTALGIGCYQVDGDDATAVYETLESVVQEIRKDGHPRFVEARVTRWPGIDQSRPEHTTGVTDIRHAWDAPTSSVPHSDWIRTSDPILRFVSILLGSSLAGKTEVVACDRAVCERIASARSWAEASPFPSSESATDGVFA